MSEWHEAPHGWTRNMPSGHMLLVTYPDTIGFSDIYLCYPEGRRQEFGRDHGVERAKDRAERIFKGRL